MNEPRKSLYRLLPYLAMASMMSGGLGDRRHSDPLSGIDIEKEYKLIQEKKSGLSRSMREMVKRRYESNDR
jgi:hypothetical protein